MKENFDLGLLCAQPGPDPDSDLLTESDDEADFVINYPESQSGTTSIAISGDPISFARHIRRGRKFFIRFDIQ